MSSRALPVDPSLRPGVSPPLTLRISTHSSPSSFQIGVANTEETRRAYRSLLITTSNLGESVSAIILTEETLSQKTMSGIPLLSLLADQNIIPGVKASPPTQPDPNVSRNPTI